MDALLAWSQNRTSRSAGFALEGNYRYINGIASVRHPDAEPGEVVGAIRSIVDDVFDIEKLGQSRLRNKEGDIVYELMEEVKTIVTHNHMERLKKWFLSQLRSADQELRDTLLALRYAQGFHYPDLPTRFTLVYRLLFDAIPPPVEDLVKSGFINRLLYETTSKNRYDDFPITVYASPYVEGRAPLPNDIELSPLPQLNAYQEAKQILEDGPDQEALVEWILSFETSDSSVPSLGPEHSLRNACDSSRWHSRKNIVAHEDTYWMVNPLVAESLARELAGLRKLKMEPYSSQLAAALKNIQNEEPAGRYFRWDGFDLVSGCFGGAFESSDLGSYDIILSSVVTRGVDKSNRNGGVLFILTDHHPLHVERWLAKGNTAIIPRNGDLVVVGQRSLLSERVVAHLKPSLELKASSEHPLESIPLLTHSPKIQHVSTALTPDSLLGNEYRPRKLQDMLISGEDGHTEFKSSLLWDYKLQEFNRALGIQVAEAVAGFMNAEGGTVLIGVDDDGDVIGLGPDYRSCRNRDGFRLRLLDLVRDHLGKLAQTHVTVEFEHVETRDICIVSARTSEKPVYLSDGGHKKFPVRFDGKTETLEMDEFYEYIERRRSHQVLGTR